VPGYGGQRNRLLDKKRIALVTGSSGFIGKRLVSRLEEQGLHVLCASRSLGIDVEDKEALNSLGRFDYLFHLAARMFVPDSYKEPEAFFRTNVLGTLNCLELCRENQAEMVFASSYVYGKPKFLPVNEDHPTDAWNPYAATKIMAEGLCQLYQREFAVNSWVFRIFNIYGPGQSNEFLIPKIISGIRNGKVELETATPKRDFVFLEDAVDALLLPLTCNSMHTGVFNVGSGYSYSVDEIAKKLIDISRQNVPICYNETKRITEISEVVADVSKLNKLGWKPETTIERGLRASFGEG
jgi:nucleoside-diphosphate-sugar epimerase